MTASFKTEVIPNWALSHSTIYFRYPAHFEQNRIHSKQLKVNAM